MRTFFIPFGKWGPIHMTSHTVFLKQNAVAFVDHKKSEKKKQSKQGTGGGGQGSFAQCVKKTHFWNVMASSRPRVNSKRHDFFTLWCYQTIVDYGWPSKCYPWWFITLEPILQITVSIWCKITHRGQHTRLEHMLNRAYGLWLWFLMWCLFPANHCHWQFVSLMQNYTVGVRLEQF